MRRWIAIAGGAAVLCAAAWYFGRPTAQPLSPIPIVAETPPVEAPKEQPPKMIEVIDLARAYEPIREPEPVLPGGVDPASFIEEPSAPRRIPPAFDEDNPYADVIRAVQEWDGSIRERMELMPRVVPDRSPWGIEGAPLQDLLHIPEFPYPVQLDVMPRDISSSLERIRELYGYTGPFLRPMGSAPIESSAKSPGVSWEETTIENGLLNFVPTVVVNGELRFVPMGVTYSDKTSPKPLHAVLCEVTTFWLQIAELYGFVGVGSGR